MFEMLQGRLMPLFSAETARRMGRAGLQQPCLIILTGLAVQLALGMVLNLYIAIPAADARASYLREIETAPGVLTAHALVALLLLATAGVMLLRSIALRDMAVIALVGAGLAALLGAFGAGELFVRDSESSVSLTMAMLTGTALLCYACLQAVIIRQRPRVREGHRGPRAAGGRRTPPAEQPLRGWPARPGFQGAYLLRRDLDGNGTVELTAHTFWESPAVIRAFAGDDITVAIVEPEAQAMLLDFDRTATHRGVIADARR